MGYASTAKPVSVGAGSGAQAKAYCSYAAVVRKPQESVRPLGAAGGTAAQLGAAGGIRPPGQAEKSVHTGRPDGPAKAPQRAAEGRAAGGNRPFRALRHQSRGSCQRRTAGWAARHQPVGAASGGRPARQLGGKPVCPAGTVSKTGAASPSVLATSVGSTVGTAGTKPPEWQHDQLPEGAEPPEDKTEANTWAT